METSHSYLLDNSSSWARSLSLLRHSALFTGDLLLFWIQRSRKATIKIDDQCILC